MITGRKIIPRKIRTTPPETLVARLNQPHLIPHKDNIFQEIDHNTIGYLDGLAATSNPAFGRDRQTSLSGTAMDINTMTSTYRDGIGFVPDKLPYVKQVSHDYGATWEDAIDTSIRTDDLWRLIFEKYRLLEADMLLKRRDEIDVLFNMMVNQRQVGKIDDELFSEIADRIKRFTQRRNESAPKNRPTAGSGSAYE